MDKKYIVGLVFAVLLLGSASAVAVRVVLHGKDSVPVKGLTSSASEPATSERAPANTQKGTAPTQSTEDFMVPVERVVAQVNLADVPKAIIDLVGETKDARAYSVEYANGSKGYRVERDIAQSLSEVSGLWESELSTNLLQQNKASADQVLYQTQAGEYKVVVVLSRLTDATTGQTISAIHQ